MSTQPKSVYTFEEYLELERAAPYKSEYRDGAILAMAGGTERHSALCVQMMVLLKRQLRNCRVYDSNLRIYIEDFHESTYADAMVICGERKFWRGQNDVVLNPTIVVEVLSPSTKKYDQTTKSGYYRSIPSLTHLLLVSQDRMAIEWSVRHDNTWVMTEYTSGSAITPLGFLVEEVYQEILAEGPFTAPIE